MPLTSSGIAYQTVALVVAPSGKTPVSDNLSAVGRGTAFTPVQGMPFNFTLTGTFSATVQIERSFDGGSTWSPLTAGGVPAFAYTAPCSESFTEYESGVQYSANCTARASGTAVSRFSQ